MNAFPTSMFPISSKALVKPEINATDIQISVPSSMQQEKCPKWITDFNMKCLEICSTTCSEKLDEMMELYIKEVKREMVYYGPGNASVVVNRMSRTMLFFYLKYVDIKEFIVISQWNEHMEDLLSLYCQLELRSSQRGKDSDIIICSRIMYALWTYLNSNEEHMLHVLLKIPNIGRKHKKILDPIFRKLLVDKKKPDYDLEYIRKLFAFKLWKRLYNVGEKKAISELAYNELQPPRSFVANYSKYHFLPRNLGTSDVHRALITAMFDIENAIKAYFEYVDNKNKRSFDNDYILPEKKTFMTEFWNSFSTTDNFDEISTTSDTFTLERIKQEVDNIDADDDCIIIEPVDNPPAPIVAPPVVVVIDATEVIDLTADESEPIVDLHTSDMPQWCTNLIKISEECVPATPPHSITEEDTATPEVIESIEMEIEKEMTTTDVDETSFKEMKELCNDENSKLKPIDIEKEMTTVEDIQRKSKLNENHEPSPPPPPPTTLLDVKITNVRRTRLDSDSTDLSLSSTTSEDNSHGHGFREITSTSHPVQEVTTTNSCPIPEDTVHYEQVDSTSNINEEIETTEVEVEVEPEQVPEPTIQTFILERTVTGIVCNDTLTAVSPSAIVSNVDFEQFACTQRQTPKDPSPVSIEPICDSFTNSNSTSGSARDGSVNDLNIVSVKHVSEESTNAPEQSDAYNLTYDDAGVTEADEFIDVGSEDAAAHNKNIDDVQSPAFEPLTQNDCVEYYQNFYKESLSSSKATNDENENNKKPKHCDIIPQVVRTYTKRATKTIPLQEDVEGEEEEEDQQHQQSEEERFTPNIAIIEQPPLPLPLPTQTEQKEQRVPLNGQKVRFSDCWESLFTNKFQMSKLEYELFNPSVVLKKLNPQHFIPHYSDYTNVTLTPEEPTTTTTTTTIPPYFPQTVDHSHRSNLYLSRYHMKGILERQEYTKSNATGEKPRARIIQINRSEPYTNPTTTHKDGTITTVKRKRGTGSPDLNINFTLPKLESLSLNSSFQHHFCTDISVCTSASKCFSDSMSGPSFCQPDPRSSPCCVEYDGQTSEQHYSVDNDSLMQVQIGFKRNANAEEQVDFKRPKVAPVTEPKKQEVMMPGPILPAEVPYWHEIDASEPLQKFDHSQACPNLLVNINLDQSEQEIHLPIKKRRVSSLKVEIKDELSYPATPMISIAELVNIERNKARNHHRPFKTPAELKEVPPLHPAYMCNINTIPCITTITDNYNISHTYSTATATPTPTATPTINYHVNNVPIIGNPHYQLPSMQPIILPVSRAPKPNWEQPNNYSYIKVPVPIPVPAAGKPDSTATKRRQTAPRRETAATNRTVQKSKSQKTKIS